jgi:predicted nucleic acid-binding protein
MKDKMFIDTNILIYSADKNDAEKQTICRNQINELGKNHCGVISTQVMQEFYSICTKKFNLDPLKIKKLLKSYENFEIVQVSTTLIYEAIDINILNQITFWDSLIVAAASQAKCTSILTEDMNHGQIISGVKIINPFNE